MDDELKLKKLNRDILENDISLILLKLVKETGKGFLGGKIPDTDKYARKILAYVKEHSVRN